MVDEVVSNDQGVNEQSGSQENTEQKVRMFTQEEMSKVASRERERAYEKAKRELMEEQSGKQGYNPSALTPQSMSPEQVEQLIAQRAPELLQHHMQQAARDAQVKQLAESFANKIDMAKDRYPDLESQLNDVDFNTFAPVITLANDLENTADVVHDLLNNPMKMGTVMSLLKEQPKMALKAMHELSTSIANNQKAMKENKQAREPFDQLKSSTNNNMDSSNMSVDDFRQMFRG